MSQNIKIEPAHCVNPGVTVTENGVIVSAVFRSAKGSTVSSQGLPTRLLLRS